MFTKQCTLAFGILALARIASAVGPCPPQVKTLADWAVLGRTGVFETTAVPASNITGDVGLSLSSQSLVGFSPTISSDGTYSTSAQVAGRIYTSSYADPTPAKVTTAVADMTAAYREAFDAPNPDFTDFHGGSIGGLTLVPGLYYWSTGLAISQDLTITGGVDDVYIFQVAGAFTVPEGGRIILNGGITPERIFFAVAGTSIITGHFEGILLSQGFAILEEGSSAVGRIASQAFVGIAHATIVSHAGVSADGACGLATVALGHAADFVILAKAGISSIPASHITGDIGVSPVASTALTGFALTASSDGTYSTSPQVNGKIYAADYSAPTPAKLTSAISDVETAYTDAMSRLNPTLNLGGGSIGGLTLTPGVYKWTSAVNIATDLTLSGGANEVFIFQLSSTLTVAAAQKIVLAGGVQPKNIFWAVAGAVTAGAASELKGNILAATSVTLITGTSLQGRLFANTAVALQFATISA